MDDTRVTKVAQKKEQLFSRKLKNPTNFNIEKFKIFNNLYALICRKSRISYYRDRFEYFSKDIKKDMGSHK